MLKYILSFLLILSVSSLAQSTWYVALDGGTPWDGTSWATAFTNIQDAINAAGTGGDTILITNGVYNSGGTIYAEMTNRIVINKANLILEGIDRDNVIISGAKSILSAWGMSNDSIRSIYVISTNVIIRNMTITDGSSLYINNTNGAGGNIYGNSSLIISNCNIFDGVSSYAGGGIYYGTVYNCNISSNRSFGAFGGKGSSGYNINVYNTLFFTNKNSCLYPATSAGVFLNSSVYKVQNCVFSNNVVNESVQSKSVAIHCDVVSSLENPNITDCLFYGNITDNATIYGIAYGGSYNNCVFDSNICGRGAISGGTYNTYANECIFKHNIAQRGGGIYNVIAYNSTIISNIANIDAGGAVNSTLYNCKIMYNNTVGSQGGGCENCVLYNCIVAYNFTKNITSGYGGGIYNAIDSDIHNTLIYGNYSAKSVAGGGGIYHNSLTKYLNINNSGIFGNYSIGAGGGEVIATTTQSNNIINERVICSLNNSSISASSNIVDGLYFISSYITENETSLNTKSTNNILTGSTLFLDNGSGYGTNYISGNFKLKNNSPLKHHTTEGRWIYKDPADTYSRSKDFEGKPRLVQNNIAGYLEPGNNINGYYIEDKSGNNRYRTEFNCSISNYLNNYYGLYNPGSYGYYSATMGNTYTLAAGFKFNESTLSTNDVILVGRTYSSSPYTNYSEVLMLTANSNLYYYSLNNNIGVRTNFTHINLLPNTDYHVAITRANTNNRSIYLNGSLLANLTQIVTNYNQQYICMGRYVGINSAYYTGLLHSIYVSTNALNDVQITNLYAQSMAKESEDWYTNFGNAYLIYDLKKEDFPLYYIDIGPYQSHDAIDQPLMLFEGLR